MGQAVDDALDAPGKGDPRIGDAKAQGVAQPDLDGNPAFFGKGHQFIGERYHKAVEIRPRHILKVAARPDAQGQGVLDDPQVFIQSLGPVQVHFTENVIIRTGNQYAGLLHAHGLDEGKVLFRRPDPGGDLRELEP